MELILWRHADALDGFPDEERPLSKKGIAQAKRMGKWLDTVLPENTLIISSPALRARQTADAIGRKYRIDPRLAVDSTPEEILAAANWPDGKKKVVIVGHQPVLGQAASLLLSGRQEALHIKKANVWWFERKEEEGITANYLRALMEPRLLPKIGTDGRQ